MSGSPVRRANLAAIACEPWMWTAADAVDLVVERQSALDDIAPWSTA